MSAFTGFGHSAADCGERAADPLHGTNGNAKPLRYLADALSAARGDHAITISVWRLAARCTAGAYPWRSARRADSFAAMSRWFCAALVLYMASCGSDRVAGRDDTPPPPAAAHADPDLARDQAEYVEDVMVFTHTTSSDEVRAQMANPVLLRDEWTAWEQQGEMTPDRIQAFYKQTKSYIYELGQWHLFAPNQRGSDIALFADLRAKRPRNVLDFGGGVGLLALPLARD